ncbi:cation:proton antiporter, partial [Francisella tularensis subsp. holarctica]|uniref:cation:proton antiporter domain-containing protein n=1 Tax=Francisella tularensis TaxID=263 RepID=UPI002381A2ED
LYGAVISFISTAVVLKLLNDSGSMKTRLGKNVLGILLIQDLAVVPMLILVRLIGGEELSISQIVTQSLGGILVISIAASMAV